MEVLLLAGFFQTLWYGALAVGAVVFVGYLSTMHWALRSVAPEKRKMRPALVWLELVPALGLVWQFFVVWALRASLVSEPYPGDGPRPMGASLTAGLAKAVVDLFAFAAAVLVTLFVEDVDLVLYASDDLVTATTGLVGYAVPVSLILLVVHWSGVGKTASRLRAERALQSD